MKYKKTELSQTTVYIIAGIVLVMLAAIYVFSQIGFFKKILGLG